MWYPIAWSRSRKTLLAMIAGAIVVQLLFGCTDSAPSAPAADTTAPATVGDLSCAQSGPESITLTWTAPEDPDTGRGLHAYDIRFSLEPIPDEAGWVAAVQCTGAPSPSAPGESDSYVATGLRSLTTYHFAIKSTDQDSNWSELSNDASGTTTPFDKELYMNFLPYSHEAPPGSTLVYADGRRVRAWSHIADIEAALIVLPDRVRTTTYSAYSPQGHEYDLSGTPTGVSFSSASSVYDASTDGEFIYAWKWYEAALVRYDLDWSNPVLLFSLPSSYSKCYMGITYDPYTGTIWLSSWYMADFHRLDNYTLEGDLVGSIDLGDGYGAGLALDREDGSLWFFNWAEERYENYATDGTFLRAMGGMTRIYGAEFRLTAD